MEKELTIPIGENLIHAKLRGDLSQPLIIFVHGLTGHMDEQIFYNGARYAEKMGFASLRYTQYDWRPKARKLRESTLASQASDLGVVMKYLQSQGADRLYLVGHSYGGPTIMLASQEHVQGVVLWEPTWDFAQVFAKARHEPSLQRYMLEWGYEILISEAMVDEAKALTGKAHDMIRNITAPLKIIAAGKSYVLDGCRKYLEAAHSPKELSIIEWADHNFDEDGAAERLFQETCDWFKKHAT